MICQILLKLNDYNLCTSNVVLADLAIKDGCCDIAGFSVKFFFQPIYTDCANEAYFDKRSNLNLFL